MAPHVSNLTAAEAVRVQAPVAVRAFRAASRTVSPFFAAPADARLFHAWRP